MSNKHNVFELIWKSKYSVQKETIDVVVKELNDEIKYLSTIALSQAVNTVSKKNVLKQIDQLRKQRDSLLMKYDDARNPRAAREINPDPQSTDENYQTVTKSVRFQKSISKRDIFKAMYARAWGSMDGLNEVDLQKMTSEDLDKQIAALEQLFD